MNSLVGIGLYTPAEAQRLTGVRAGKIVRWLKGHELGGKRYAPLWAPQVDLDDGKAYLGFRDLMEVRVADAFIAAGVPAMKVREGITLAREVVGVDRPLSTDRFRTDGRDIFLRVVEKDELGEEREKLLSLFKQQYAFSEILAPSLRGIVFDQAGIPNLWRPLGKRGSIVVDPLRSFGQPLEERSGVPTKALANAALIDGIDGAAAAFDVSPAAVRHALTFENDLANRKAA